VEHARQAKDQRVSQRQIAECFNISPRTLRHWKRRDRQGDFKTRPRGRPPLTVDAATRNQVIRFLHRVTGPSIGLPALRALFPKIPRCILENLLTRYRRVWRRRYRQRGYRLTWRRPGATWAMDHSEASQPVDGIYPYLFAVRDLASHRQLAWAPVRTEQACEALAVLQQLFRLYGPPLVLKSDNGSAFIADLMHDALDEQSVSQLFSPPRRPQYNGALERSNGTLKTYTHQHAVSSGHPFRWTSEDLEHARQLANTISRPWGHRKPTPDECFRDRTPISDEDRRAFQQELDRQRLVAGRDLGLTLDAELPRNDRARLDRLAISRTLQQLGYLTKTRVCRSPRRPKRKSTDELRRARQDQQPDERRNPPPSSTSSPDLTQDASSRQVSVVPLTNANNLKETLAPAQPADTMPAAANDLTMPVHTTPAIESTHVKWTFSSWLRRLITPLHSLGKAAKNPRG
jgi:transposase InsO family protein